MSLYTWSLARHLNRAQCSVLVLDEAMEPEAPEGVACE
eukprot:CAMPEP_0198336208 /NCGR_PEP_ID=MMETSP1450-20131203/20853_1 /TAXON_ID=753684 ORGANISM="Madagascaria erythrocladiodes, Strain CCMP3234" /NCGR_SAMPLE_ID=MMETSP1450 /ASSEMBLY_ACC=CAM_ASM_001115 /LENGTH=37 /DNA_ID= /DNA_START= /DNA_END= /DNA_ORIENTATION=